MKHIIAALILASYGVAAHASTNSTCESVADVAETVMTVRQSGASLRDALAAADDMPALFRQMIVAAYELPEFTTSEYKQREIRRFADTWHIKCLRSQ